ncbi:ABC-three component system middle component 7 [Facklamia languida]
MKIPGKLFSFNQSVISKFPLILENLNEPKTPQELFKNVQSSVGNPVYFIEILDSLYALGKINMSSEGRLYIC